MARMTALQVTQLDNMNSASQRSGGLGTRIDSLEYGTSLAPSAGSIVSLSAVKYSTTPALASVAAIHAAVTLTNATQNISTSITNPDFPRILTVKGNDSNVAGNVVITGTNYNDEVITETIVASGTATVSGAKAFKTVTSYVVPAYAVAGTETIQLGSGAKVGFPIAIPNASVVISKSFNNSSDAGTVTAASTVEGSIYAAAGTFDAVKILELVFLA